MDNALRPRALSRPRVGFGVITVALVALVSGGTGLLVSHGARQLQLPAPRVVVPIVPSPPSVPVVVRRAPGSAALPRVIGPAVLVPVAPLAPPVGPAVEPPDVQPPVGSPVVPPVVEPPLTPPQVEPPARPPVVQPEERPRREPRRPEARRTDAKDKSEVHGKGRARGQARGQDREHPVDRGKHLGQYKA